MGDIWAFLLQTLSGSGVAAVLLVIKGILKDKLSPRWQFSAWGLLALALLIPVGLTGGYVLIDWQLLLETIKSWALGIYSVTQVVAPVPLLPLQAPASLADWIFIIYLAGVLLFAARYILSYLRLRRILSKGETVTSDPVIDAVQQQYDLKACKAVKVPGLQSAFVCGVFHPVLVLPAEGKTDEKVILHELLHLKHRDVIWGVIISIFRCIHWCNPFLWYCADLAMNDMETLCDQRVLERLRGEERREYGKILLSMVNVRYARAPGTSSVANGGKNIQKRIEAIARFKKYPKGMAVVSVCILITLISPLLVGTPIHAAQWNRHGDTEFEQFQALASARLSPCTTPAGAADTYAKSVISQNALYRAMCMATDQKIPTMEQIGQQIGLEPHLQWDTGIPEPIDTEDGYYLYNIRKIDENRLEGLLVMRLQYGAEKLGYMRICTQKIALCREGKVWYAEPLEPFAVQESIKENLGWSCQELPAVTYQAESEGFLVKANHQSIYHVDNDIEPEQPAFSLFPGESMFDGIPKPDAEFSRVNRSNWHSLTYVGPEEKKIEIHQVGVSSIPWDGEGERPVLTPATDPNTSGSSNFGESWNGADLGENWDREIELNGGGGSEPVEGFDDNLPECYAADFYINGEKKAELVLQEVQP